MWSFQLRSTFMSVLECQSAHGKQMFSGGIWGEWWWRGKGSKSRGGGSQGENVGALIGTVDLWVVEVEEDQMCLGRDIIRDEGGKTGEAFVRDPGGHRNPVLGSEEGHHMVRVTVEGV